MQFWGPADIIQPPVIVLALRGAAHAAVLSGVDLVTLNMSSENMLLGNRTMLLVLTELRGVTSGMEGFGVTQTSSNNAVNKKAKYRSFTSAMVPDH